MYKKIILAPVLLLFVSFSVNDGLMEKFRKAISQAYQMENFDLQEIKIPTETAERLKIEVNNENLFHIVSGGKSIGYAYLGEAPSKERMYDYAVFFDRDMVIIKSKVLIYREEFGRQIGTRRWLDQFKGMNTEKRPEYGKNIAAISGATISATSMTKAVNDVLESIAILQSEGFFSEEP